MNLRKNEIWLLSDHQSFTQESSSIYNLLTKITITYVNYSLLFVASGLHFSEWYHYFSYQLIFKILKQNYFDYYILR